MGVKTDPPIGGYLAYLLKFDVSEALGLVFETRNDGGKG